MNGYENDNNIKIIIQKATSNIIKKIWEREVNYLYWDNLIISKLLIDVWYWTSSKIDKMG